MKYIAEIKLASSIAVAAKAVSLGSVADSGAVFVTCPELGFEGQNLLYCRYGLALPSYEFEVDDKVLIEPTVGDDSEFFVVGYADSKLSLEAQILGTTALIELLKHQVSLTGLHTALTTWTPVPLDGGAALKTALAAFLSLPLPDYSSILSIRNFIE